MEDFGREKFDLKVEIAELKLKSSDYSEASVISQDTSQVCFCV